MTELAVNDHLYATGGPVQDWTLIIQGIVVGTARRAGRNAVAMSMHGKGEWLGEEPLLSGESSRLDYICATDVRIGSIPGSALLAALEHDPAFNRQLQTKVARQSHRQYDRIKMMRLGNASLRICAGLAQIVESCSNSVDGRALQATVAVPINQTILSSFCGVSRSAFVDMVSLLQANQWLRASYSHTEFLRLGAWLGFLRDVRDQRLNFSQPSPVDLLAHLQTCDAEAQVPQAIGSIQTPPPSFGFLVLQDDVRMAPDAAPPPASLPQLLN